MTLRSDLVDLLRSEALRRGSSLSDAIDQMLAEPRIPDDVTIVVREPPVAEDEPVRVSIECACEERDELRNLIAFAIADAVTARRYITRTKAPEERETFLAMVTPTGMSKTTRERMSVAARARWATGAYADRKQARAESRRTASSKSRRSDTLAPEHAVDAAAKRNGGA